jgi:TonB-dependent receptor
MIRNVFFILFVIILGANAYSQDGVIRGTVFDGTTGEYLPGVTIYIAEAQKGTITDLDGKFSLTVRPGSYDLRVSFISYETINVEDIEVKPGEVTILDDMGLQVAKMDITEVTITASAIRNTENALLAMKKKSSNLMDGISAVNLRKIGDSDAASSIKRIPGVSIEGGKYVYVRGLGDRYTKTILNGVDIPGLDPDRNSLQMDIFPTNIIDNIIVHKSFSAELPADFTGGVVDISIKDFPEDKKASLSMSAGYNPNFHFVNDYLTYEGGSTDFLGFDDGTREIPATQNIPFFSQVVGNPTGTVAQRYREILGDFNPNLKALEQKSFMDYSLSASFGNQKALEKFSIGYNFAFSYKNDTEFYRDAEYGRYGLSGDPGIYEMEVRELQTGNYGVNNVFLSGMAGFAIKTLKSKYRINIIHLQNGESRAGIFDYTNADQGAIFYGYQHNLDYSQRSLTNLLIDGKHNYTDSKWELEWKVSPTLSTMEDPDIRFTRYENRDGKFSIGTEVGFPERIWRNLQETNIAGLFHARKDFSFRGRDAKLSFGGAQTFKQRDYVIRNFAINIRNIPLTGDPNEIFSPENIWPRNGEITSGTTYEAPFIPVNPNKFNASTSNTAAYASTELGLFDDLKLKLGLRAENYIQIYTGQDQLGLNVLDNETVLESFDLFPSINLIYSITPIQNLRVSYSKTIARPSFKELSYAEIYDPISGRIFIGGLFRDANDIDGVEYWDGKLQSTDIFNYDLRWELFLPKGQMISLSGFYKKFIRPIEIVQFATQTGSFQPRNVGDGEVYGAEAELRFNLGTLLGESLNSLHFTSNLTITRSRIELSKTEYDSRLANARTGQEVNKYRDMAGQAPYIINSGLSYNGGEKGFWKGLEAGLYYNVQGETLEYVGIVDRPDIYTEPFHSLNFNSSKRFGKEKKMSIGLKVENILNDKKESVFQSFRAENQYFTRLDPGFSFKLSFSYSIF